MMVTMFKSKIHRATITQADLNYEGSITLDPDLMEAAGIQVYEQVHVLNINTGDRFTTYAILGQRGAGVVCLNGAAARKGQPGDLVIILTYAQMSHEEAQGWVPRVVLVDEKNRIAKVSGEIKVAPHFDEVR
jgi:aspartate 1-decarboxylase